MNCPDKNQERWGVYNSNQIRIFQNYVAASNHRTKGNKTKFLILYSMFDPAIFLSNVSSCGKLKNSTHPHSEYASTAIKSLEYSNC